MPVYLTGRFQAFPPLSNAEDVKSAPGQGSPGLRANLFTIGAYLERNAEQEISNWREQRQNDEAMWKQLDFTVGWG